MQCSQVNIAQGKKMKELFVSVANLDKGGYPGEGKNSPNL